MPTMARSRIVLAGVGLVAVGVIAAALAIAFVTHHDGGRGLAPVAVSPAAAPSTLREPPPPPAGATVLAREAGSWAVALAVEPQRLTATVLSPSGGGATGLHVVVEANGHAPLSATSCGAGCYRANVRASGGTVRVEVGKRSATFVVPLRRAPGKPFVRRATRAFSNLRSVVYREHLASSPTLAIDTLWQLESPNRLTYAIRGGSDAVVIGQRRWDRAHGGRWIESQTTPLLLPSPPWGTTIVDAHVLSSDRRTTVVSWANPDIPAWFTGSFDTRTALPRTLEMIAAAHFMHHRYLSFNRPLAIRPPTSSP